MGQSDWEWAHPSKDDDSTPLSMGACHTHLVCAAHSQCTGHAQYMVFAADVHENSKLGNFRVDSEFVGLSIYLVGAPGSPTGVLVGRIALWES